MFHVLKELRDSGTLDACRDQLEKDSIPDDWRGQAWETSKNLEGPYEPRLSVDAIVGYRGEVRNTQRVRFERLAGRAYHALYWDVVSRSKRAILSVTDWSKAYGLAQYLRSQAMRVADKILRDLRAPQQVQRARISRVRVNDLRTCLSSCWRYEMQLLEAEIQFNLNRNPAMNPVRLVDFIPIESEVTIDGSRLHLSDRLSADGLFTRTPVVIEIKTGPKDQDRHRAGVAGYALAYESQHRTDVDFGCVMYLKMRGDRLAPQLDCDVFAIVPKFRSLFVEWRNERMREEQARQGGLAP